jgi:hypothetical protein
MRTRHSVLALALLIVLSAISGCRQAATSVTDKGDIELSSYHTPIIYIFAGQVLTWHPSRNSGAITLTFDQGLCKETGPLHGTPDRSAVCTTIADQTFRNHEPNKYKLTVSGSDEVSFEVNVVKPCTGCKTPAPK